MIENDDLAPVTKKTGLAVATTAGRTRKPPSETITTSALGNADSTSQKHTRSESPFPDSSRQTIRDKIPLQLRKILKNSMGSFFKVFFIGGFLSIIVIYALDPVDGFAPKFCKEHGESILFVWFTLLLLFMFWRMIYEYLHYRTYFYDIVDSNLVIRKGVIAQREITLPFSRITDVYVVQDLFDVMLGLYDVNISTPTQESGAFAHINGVNKRGAYRLKQIILEQIKETDSN